MNLIGATYIYAFKSHHLLNLHLQIGEVPEDWRKANVIPDLKGQRYLAENYRPISLTSVCRKVMEHIVASRIVKHGEANKILYAYNMTSERIDPAMRNSSSLSCVYV